MRKALTPVQKKSYEALMDSETKREEAEQTVIEKSNENRSLTVRRSSLLLFRLKMLLDWLIDTNAIILFNRRN